MQFRAFFMFLLRLVYFVIGVTGGAGFFAPPPPPPGVSRVKLKNNPWGFFVLAKRSRGHNG